MKKITYILVLFIISITLVNAKNCTVISGTGKNIGDEISCGSEHFYVVSNDGTNVKMLGKYNLLTETTYDSIMIDEYYFTYENEIYKNKQIIDRINQTGILLTLEQQNDFSWDETVQKYKITKISGKGKVNEDYKVVVFDEEIDSYKQLENDSKVVEVLNKGYKIYNILRNSSNNKYFGAIFYKEENIEYKTIFLNEERKTEIDLIFSEDVSKVLQEGYRINSYLRDNYEYVYPRTYHNYYAVTFSKEKGTSYKVVTFDDGMTKTDEEILKKEEVKKLLEEGYTFTSDKYYYTSTTSNNKKYYDYYAIILKKDENIERKTILLDGSYRTTDDLGELTEIKELIEEGYLIETSYRNQTRTVDGKKQSDYYAVTLKNDKSIGTNWILQNEKAVGINGDVNGPNYPFYGLIVQNEELSDLVWNEEYNDGETYGAENYQDFDISYHSYFEYYKQILQEMGYPINIVSTLSVKDLNEMTKSITGKEIPLIEWYENKKTVTNGYDWEKLHILGNIKDFYGEEYQEKYSWIWGTSYWLKTKDSNHYIYDINTMGDLCLTDVCNSNPSRGFRPLVTIASKDIEHKIEIKTNGNGTIEATHTEAQNGEQIKFTIKPKKGYELKEVKVTDSEGNILTFKDYTFTMPASSVTIEAIFEISNPNTSATNITILILLGMCSIFAMKKHKKRINWLTN